MQTDLLSFTLLDERISASTGVKPDPTFWRLTQVRFRPESRRLITHVNSHSAVTIGKAGTMRNRVIGLLAIWLLLTMQLALASEDKPLNTAAAKAVFTEANQLCESDRGQLWSVSLCGPIMLVDPSTRKIITTQADGSGVLHEKDGVFVGVLPKDVPMANTTVAWSGTSWIQYIWPLPDDEQQRRILLAHEFFHRIQNQLGLDAANPSNPQLDTREGRYDLQLEWRALVAAISAKNDASRRAHIADALAFRADRYRRFPTAAETESALERNEGLAEYTGVMVGMATMEEREAMAQRDIDVHAHDPSFVRAFAYATGPAYGLLLDEYRPNWRVDIRNGGSPADLLAQTLDLSLSVASNETALEAKAADYDGKALWDAETLRKQTRDKLLADYRRTFITAHVFILPLRHPRLRFDPRNLVPLDGHGTVYPTLQASDVWGHIEVDQGGLLADDWSQLTLGMPFKRDGSHLSGKGWKLELAPGWQLSLGKRSGDVVVTQSVGQSQ